MTICLAALAVAASPAHADSLAFSGPQSLDSDTGHLMLNWQSDEPVTIRMATRPDFADAATIYQGPAHSFFLSGLDNGEYFLRLSSDSGAQSAPLTLSVTHQSLTRALWLVLIGSIITLAIIVTILRGPRDE